MSELGTILDLANYNLKTRKNSKQSCLGELQNRLIDLTGKLDLTPEQIEKITGFVVTNPSVLEDDGVSYQSVTETNTYLNNLNNKKESLEEETIIKTR